MDGPTIKQGVLEMQEKDKVEMNHGTDNPAMVWESTGKLPIGVEKTWMEAVVGDDTELGHVKAVEHMQRPKHPTSYFESLAHHLKNNIGSGTYAMGFGFKNAGMLLAPILITLIGLICFFNQHILLNCAKRMREKHKLNYYLDFDETVELSFEAGPNVMRKYSKWSRSAVNFSIITAQLGFCCVDLVFMSRIAEQILRFFGVQADVHLLMVPVIAVELMLILIRNLKYLAPFSMFATLAMLTSVAITLYMTSHDLPPLSSRPAVSSLTKLPLFFGATIYAYEGISLILPLQSEMKHPEQFNSPLGVLNVGNGVLTVLLLVVGAVGFLKYGDYVEGNLTLNLPNDNVLSHWVKVTVGVGILFTYPLIFYVPIALMRSSAKALGPFESPVLNEYALRITLCLLTFTLAELIPNLGVFISLVGAVSSTALALVFPPLCDLCVRWADDDFGALSWRKWVAYLSLVLALFGFCTGTYVSFQDIVYSFFS